MTVNMYLTVVNDPECCVPLTDETLSVRVARIGPTSSGRSWLASLSPSSGNGGLGEELVEKSSDTTFEFVTDGSDFLHCLA
jgi:hypothetical protein